MKLLDIISPEFVRPRASPKYSGCCFTASTSYLWLKSKGVFNEINSKETRTLQSQYYHTISFSGFCFNHNYILILHILVTMWIFYDILTNVAKPQISSFCCSKWIWSYKIFRNGKKLYTFRDFIFLNTKTSKFWKQRYIRKASDSTHKMTHTFMQFSFLEGTEFQWITWSESLFIHICKSTTFYQTGELRCSLNSNCQGSIWHEGVSRPKHSNRGQEDIVQTHQVITSHCISVGIALKNRSKIT